MIVYRASKLQFLADNNDREIDDVIRSHFLATTGNRVSQTEQRSWRESLGYMARVLSDEAIPHDAGIAVEYHIPQSSKRLDMLVAGHTASGAKSAVIVELKQWDHVEVTGKDAIVSTFLGGGLRETVHPSYQAWSYAELMKSFNAAVYEGHIAVWPCAYLHNYSRDGAIDALHYEPYTSRAPLFLKGETERAQLRHFICRHVQFGGGMEVISDIEAGPIRPSKELADSVARLLKGNREFLLIDDQKMVFEAAKAAALRATPERPHVVIIEGGPGTGKSVVALNLLSDRLAGGPSRVTRPHGDRDGARRQRGIVFVGAARLPRLPSGSGAAQGTHAIRGGAGDREVSMSDRRVLIIAGPNGAGKTTFARAFLPREANCPRFINADLIAAGLSPFEPEAATVRAARVMLDEIDACIARGESFAFETTLAGRAYLQRIVAWRAAGWHVTLFFLALPDAEAAIARVANRVRQGGHDVPEGVIRRRFAAGRSNFERLYRDVVDDWMLYDNAGEDPLLLDWKERR